MSPAQLLAYLGPALIYTLLLTALFFLLLQAWLHMRGHHVRLRGHHAWTIGLVVFFLTLTQHPFPDPATLDCSRGGEPPILQPFNIFRRFSRLAEHGFDLRPWLTDKVVQSSGMNFLLCLVIGFAIARYLPGQRTITSAFAFGMTLSLTAELLQLTGILGFYPCPYRQFEVDDLILNISGVVSGALLARLFHARQTSLL